MPAQSAPADERHLVTWERRQAELWDRVFQVTQDVVGVADGMGDAAGSTTVRTELLKTALDVGVELVRANVAEESEAFYHHLQAARLRAIETDYWLRVAYLVQQREEVQRDLSSIITQYAAVVDLIQKFMRHARAEANPATHHARGPKVSLG